MRLNDFHYNRSFFGLVSYDLYIPTPFEEVLFESPFTSPEIRFLGLPNTFSTRYSEDFGCLRIMTPVVKESLANNKLDLCQVPEVAGGGRLFQRKRRVNVELRRRVCAVTLKKS